MISWMSARRRLSLGVVLVALSALGALAQPAAPPAVPHERAPPPAGMVIDYDVAVPMGDGAVLSANVFRPAALGRYPVIMSHSPYGKDIHLQDYNPSGWNELMKLVPEACAAPTTCRYMNWETVDPERWVPQGYVVVRLDARGSGKSPGYLDYYSPRENQDYYDAIEWAGAQPWSNGKIGLLGISYYAQTQWRVAALRPPHLAAILPWEGLFDLYRESTHHGGMLGENYFKGWQVNVLQNQYGNPKGFIDRETGARSNGPALSEAQLKANRLDWPGDIARHALDDEWMRQRTPDVSRIEVPVLSAGNWGGLGRHLRGNIEGFQRAGSKDKWLSMHTGTHFEAFYDPKWVKVQMAFFDHYLKGADNGWEKTPPVQITVRRPDGQSLRYENEWPLARTEWSKVYLDGRAKALTARPPKAGAATYPAIGDGVTFSMAPFTRETEITGPLSARLYASSTTADMDVFVTVRAFAPDGTEVTFPGANDPKAPVTQGWLRASHRKLDPARSLPYRPWHTHDEVQKLTPGEVYPLDVEIWPTNFVFPKGYRLAVTIQGKDFERPGTERQRGSGPFLHTDPDDRGADFKGDNTLITGGDKASYLLLPVIPAK